jgi:integrase
MRLDLAGVRDRALLLLGFAGAMRRAELIGLDVEHLTWTTEGLKLLIERSKTDAEGEGAEIAIPRSRVDDTCPVAALKEWLALSEIAAGPLFRKVNRGGAVETSRLSPDAVRQIPSQARGQGRTERHVGGTGQPAWPARRVRDDRLPQWRAGRRDHGSHAASQPDHNAQLRSARQTQPGEPCREVGPVN